MADEHKTWLELRVIREKNGDSLTSLAKRAEMSLGYLSDLENGKREPNAGVTKKLAMALNVPVSVLEKHRYEQSVPA
jgi:transcriptional regulator with XRE-family HTH domain